MARYSQPAFDFYQQSPSTLNAKPSYSEDDEMSVLDDKILDSTSPELASSVGDHRRSSYEQAPEAFAHRDSVWSDFSQQARHESAHLAHPLFESAPNPFTHPSSTYGHQASWQLPKDSGSCTPAAMYEPFPSDLDNNGSAPFSGGAVGPVSSINVPSMSYRAGLNFPGAVAMSPQSSQGWMPAATDISDSITRPTKSPTYRHGSPLTVRRDGIRKKNARFEIPAERTLSNIDHLISQSTNEEEIKELKQQKRLLRNRQAALDSRQRKKLHTEKLEEEKKQFTQVINDLEEELHNMRLREADLLREKGEWMAARDEFSQYVATIHREKEDIIQMHTLETADLRKKNNILKETVEKLERQGRSTAPTNVAPDFSDFESMMDGTPWEDFTMVNSLSLDADPAPQQSMAVAANEKATDRPANGDYPFSWNAFYMCLLFGAFVASNSTAFSSRSIPQMSEEYRAESANVLKAVLSATPAELSSAGYPAAVASSGAAPLPTTISGAEMAQMTGSAAPASNLDELHNTLTMATKEQEQEQVFSLNADQYNSLTTFEDTNPSYKTQQQPSNLQQALAAMRGNAVQNRVPSKATSDVYSRSLMWDRVPDKVIQDFRRMVQEYGGATPVKEENPGFAQA